MFSVTITEKGGPQTVSTFDKTEVTIGRVKGNDIVLPKGNVSKRHSRIVVKDGKFIIVDLKSTNGTYVNGRKISAPQVIKEADKIYIGDFILTVAEQQAQQESAPPPSPPGPPSPSPSSSSPGGPGGPGSSPGGPGSSPMGPPPGMGRSGSGPGGPPSGGPGMSADRGPGGMGPGPGPGPGGPGMGPGRGPGGPGGPGMGPGSSSGMGPGSGPSNPGMSSGPSSPGMSGGPSSPGMSGGPSSPGMSGGPSSPGMSGGPSSGPGRGPGSSPSSPGSRGPGSGPSRGPGSGPSSPSPGGGDSGPSHSAPKRDSQSGPRPGMGSSAPAPRPSLPAGERLPVGRATMPAKPQLADSQDPGAQNRIRAKRMVMETYVSRFDPRELPQQYPPSHEWKDRAYNDLSRVVDEVGGQFPQETDRNAVLENAANEAVALGPLEYFLDDDSVTSIYVHGPNQIVVEKEGRLQVAAEAWSNADFLYLTAQRLLSMQGFTPQNSPAFNEVRFSDGTLVQVVLPPVAVGAPVITVRKPRRKFPNLSDLVGQGTLSNNMAEFLHQCVEARRTILVAGPASSGRTTLVNALLGLVPDGARIVAVEQTSMLQLPQRTAVTLEAQPATSYAPGLSAEELAESAVRMRADRVVVEDISAGEAHGLLLAAAAGAAGSVGVISALSAQDAVSGLVQLAQTSRHKPDYTGLVAQVARSVDVVLVCNRFGDGSRRVVEIAEIVGTTDNRYELDTIFTWSGGGMGPGGGGNGRFSASGTVPRFYQELENGGVRLDTNIFRD